MNSSFKVKKPKDLDRYVPEEGSHPARLVQLLDLGTHTSSFQGKERTNRKIRLTWELVDDLHVFDEAKGEEPAWVSRFYTMSLDSRSALFKDLKNWVGSEVVNADEFDLLTLLGKPCLVTVSHSTRDEKVYAEVDSVNSVPKGMNVTDLHNTEFYYLIDEHGFEGEVWDSLPEWVQNMVKDSEEYLPI